MTRGSSRACRHFAYAKSHKFNSCVSCPCSKCWYTQQAGRTAVERWRRLRKSRAVWVDPRRSGLRSAEPESPHETDPGLLHVDSVGSQGTAAPHSRAHRSMPTKEMYRRCIALVFFFASRCVRSSAQSLRTRMARSHAEVRGCHKARAAEQRGRTSADPPSPRLPPLVSCAPRPT